MYYIYILINYSSFTSVLSSFLHFPLPVHQERRRRYMKKLNVTL